MEADAAQAGLFEGSVKLSVDDVLVVERSAQGRREDQAGVFIVRADATAQ
jgi:hypothetical protein